MIEKGYLKEYPDGEGCCRDLTRAVQDMIVGEITELDIDTAKALAEIKTELAEMKLRIAALEAAKRPVA